MFSSSDKLTGGWVKWVVDWHIKSVSGCSYAYILYVERIIFDVFVIKRGWEYSCECVRVFVDLSEEPGSLASLISFTAEALDGNLHEFSECRALHPYFKAFWKEVEKQVFHPHQTVLRQFRVSDSKSHREAKTLNSMKF